MDNRENTYLGEYNKKLVNAWNLVYEGKIPHKVLYIYGESGIGKSKILKFLFNQYKNNFEDPLYTNVNTFSNEVYELISDSEKINQYKKKCASKDLFVIDDFDSLITKPKPLEVFAQVLNSLYLKNSFVVICGNKDVNQYKKLNEKVLHRINSGLSIKLEKPTNKDIENFINFYINLTMPGDKITDEAINFIKNRCNGNFSILEGLINKIYFYLNDLPDIKEKIITLENLKK
jgi:chromosomal replication initiation ATPase DnaA